MNINFKTKFIIANLFVVFVTMIILAIFVIQGLSFSSYSTTQQQLLSMGSDAQLYISQELQSLNEEDPPELSYQNNAIALSKNLARIYNTRVVLFNDEGSPLADSATVELSDESYSSEDIEIALTLNEGQSVSSYRRSDGRSAIHYAMPLFINSERVGVLFFIHSMDFLDEIISQIIMLFFAASLLGFVVVFIISHFMSQSLFRPIRTLAQSAKKMSAGNFEEELTYHGDDEIGDLILNFNKMSTHIQEKIQEIESEKQKLQSVLSSIEDGVIALDLESSAFIINDRAREILQLSQPELEATNILDRPDFAEIFDIVAREHKTVTRKFEYNDRILLAHGKNIKREDTITGILLVVRDITQIEELENQQRLFISSVSHELRTPLTTIIGYTNLLQRRKEENPELLDKSLQTIHDEGQRLLRLVSDLLDLSKYENTEFQMIFADVHLSELIEEVVQQMRIKANKFNVEIACNHPDLPVVKADRDRLKQVLINILDNAIQYSYAEGVIKVVSALSQDEESVEISIRDFGPGIDPKKKDRIFEAFYRMEEDRSRQAGGSGLGLAISKDIIEKHHGTISVESQIDEGTLITITLPLS